MKIDTWITLENDKVILYPLKEEDFDALYQVASDPMIWEQHPSKDRWQQDVFRIFFEGAIKSKGAFRIVAKASGDIIGSTRIYDYNEEDNSVFIGYTFYATAYWGTGINHSVKELMLDYVFQFITKVYFHVGASNIRSQIAVTRLNAKKIDEQEVSYFGEASRYNFVYCITKEDWQQK